MNLLQQRLEDPSAVMKAAEDLSPEQRLLARDIEISATIKTLKAEQDDIRDQLKAHHTETGERVSLGCLTYAPISKDNWTYDARSFIAKFGKAAKRFLVVSSEKVTAAILSGEITATDLEGIRTNKPTLTHHISKDQT